MRHCLLAVVIVCVVAPAITVAQDKVYVKNRILNLVVAD